MTSSLPQGFGDFTKVMCKVKALAGPDATEPFYPSSFRTDYQNIDPTASRGGNMTWSPPRWPCHMSQVTLEAFPGGLLELSRCSWLLPLPFPLYPARNTGASDLGDRSHIVGWRARREKNLVLLEL